LVARRQYGCSPRAASPDAFAGFTADFRAGLEEAGFVEGRDVKIEYRWAEAHDNNLPALAAELENSGVTVVVANGTTGPAIPPP
jgi:putative ABC transport system substrate-binding protein